MIVLILVVVSIIAFSLWYGLFHRFKRIKRNKKSLNVIFLHPDLGIGGAENLIVNAAIALQHRKHTVRIYTSHHDPSHCFEETKNQGPLAPYVYVYGDWLPRTILGKLYAACAYARMMLLSMIAIVKEFHRADIFFVDQISVPIPMLRLTGIPVMFYCHFPDKLLCVERQSMIKKLYRLPLDLLEEVTTGAADQVLVNSLFTASIFKESFNMLQNINLQVLYPPVNTIEIISELEKMKGSKGYPEPTFVSINRYERKKNIELAIRAFIELKELVPDDQKERIRLIVAGGYDPLNTENHEYRQELDQLVQRSQIVSQVTFLTSISNEKKWELLHRSKGILYTPDREHFGIVPVEAMCAQLPVIAVASGGPKESILHEETGYLCKNQPHEFAKAMMKVLSDEKHRCQMGIRGRERVKQYFSLMAFGDTLEKHIFQVLFYDDKAK